MFGHNYHHPWHFGWHHFYPAWNWWRWPAYRVGFTPVGGIGGVGAAQVATNAFAGNYNGSAVSGQRMVNTGTMEEVGQDSTPTVVR